MDALETKRLIIRPWRESDFGEYFEYSANPLVGLMAGWKPHKSRAEAKNYFDRLRRKDCAFAIVLKSSKKVIGNIGLYSTSLTKGTGALRTREIGYALNPEFWHCGFMTEAAFKVLEVAKKALLLDAVLAGVFDCNLRSRALLERLGFGYCFSREWTTDKDIFCDVTSEMFYLIVL
ncbi:MAG: GNAT family N-acetyltransferase [Oscillospiraceae bacterium]